MEEDHRMKFLQPNYEGYFGDLGPIPASTASLRRWQMRQNRHFDQARWWSRWFGGK